MSIWTKIGRLFTVDDSILDRDFSLISEDNGANNKRLNQEASSEIQKNNMENKENGTIHPLKMKTIKPVKIKDLVRTEQNEKSDKLTDNLAKNRQRIEKMFFLPQNSDVIIRDFTINHKTPIPAFAVFIEGISSKEVINQFVLQPLMLLAILPPDREIENRLKTVKEKLLPGNQVMEYEKWEDVKKNILAGSTAVFIENVAKALLVETKGWEQRGVGETTTETVVRGPHDAFTENLRSNTGLVRSKLRSERLVTEMMQVGELAPTDVAVMYIDGIANPRLVNEVKRRIKSVKVDFLQDSGMLEQLIEDPPRALLPKMTATERPDRVAASLTEGYVAIFVGQSPYILVLPILMFSMIHTAEDVYLRFPFGSLIRLIRFVGFFLALLLPAIYIAITNYHPEMIPTDLMLAIAAARERVPFPAVLEVLLMEFSVELIREAGIRIPNVIGPTIGIVGALILGQSAVQAGIISPLLVIVVAVTALSTFTLPNYNFSFAVRALRFIFFFLASVWGFYGIALGIMMLLMHWGCSKSFGVPMLSPIAPYKPSSPDALFRGPIFMQENRPRALRPMDKKRQRQSTLSWDSTTNQSENGDTSKGVTNFLSTDQDNSKSGKGGEQNG